MSDRLSRSDALGLWHGVMLDGVTSSDPDLSARQIVILTTVYLQEGPHTVRSLAKSLDVTKAVVTRALDTLAGYGYLARAEDPRDGRSVVVARTGAGSQYLTRLGDTIVQTLKIVRLKVERNEAAASAMDAQGRRLDSNGAQHAVAGAGAGAGADVATSAAQATV